MRRKRDGSSHRRPQAPFLSVHFEFWDLFLVAGGGSGANTCPSRSPRPANSLQPRSVQTRAEVEAWQILAFVKTLETPVPCLGRELSALDPDMGRSYRN